MDKWTLYNPGDSVINTKTHRAATVIAVIPAGSNSTRDLYVIDSDAGYLIVDDEDLVVYNKYYWDELDMMALHHIKEVLD